MIPTTPPDVLVALIPIVKAAVGPSVRVGSKKDNSNVFVMLRTDLQNPATPLSRYCRVGVTVWWVDTAGNARLDEAFDLSNVACKAILESKHPMIIDAEWQSGPADTIDAAGKTPVQYSTLLLEVANNL